MSETPFRAPQELDISGHKYVRCGAVARDAKSELLADELTKARRECHDANERSACAWAVSGALRDQIKGLQADLERQLANAKPERINGGTVRNWYENYSFAIDALERCRVDRERLRVQAEEDCGKLQALRIEKAAREQLEKLEKDAREQLVGGANIAFWHAEAVRLRAEHRECHDLNERVAWAGAEIARLQAVLREVRQSVSTSRQVGV